MNLLDTSHLLSYWSAQQWQVNLLILLHLAGAAALGLLLGYERSYHGRAPGMRTYALVCVASAGLVILLAFPGQWYGGMMGGVLPPVGSDPTRVIQGVVTGVGFLCAGVIMKEGMSISGLTTAASIWSASAIGVLVGIGFYFAAIMLTLLCASLMMWGSRLEMWLPSHPAIGVMLRSQVGAQFNEADLRHFIHAQGYRLASGSITIEYCDGRQEWRFVCTARANRGGPKLSTQAGHLPELPGLQDYMLTHARN